MTNSTVTQPQRIRGAWAVVFSRFMVGASVILWAVLILLPLLILVTEALQAPAQTQAMDRIYASLFRSLTLSAVIAASAVLLGYAPGRLLGTSRKHNDLLLLLLLMPLVLPQYLLYYAWSLLLSPTTHLGAFLSGRPSTARFVGTFTSSCVLVLWYWPLAALLIAQGWRTIDRQIWDCASVDAGVLGRFRHITLPLLGRPLLMAFGVCFVLSLSGFATFHLAGIQTIGTELAVLYQEQFSAGSVARAAWPVAAVALVVAAALGKSSGSWQLSAAPRETINTQPQRRRWFILLLLVGISLVAPIALLVANLRSFGPLTDFMKIHPDALLWSLLIAAVTSVIAHIIACGAFSVRGRDADGKAIGLHFLSTIMRVTIFLAMLIPASLVAGSLVQMFTAFKLPSMFRQGWYMVSAGQAVRFAGIALIVFMLTRYAQHRQLSEMAAVDGASPAAAWWHVHLPGTWPLLLGSFVLVAMLSLTELPATMMLLPPGLPNFAQNLLNQMHYAMDQQVITSCLVLVCLFLVLAVVVVLLLRLVRRNRRAFMSLMVACALCIVGCDEQSQSASSAKVLSSFGRTGPGRGEFMYPRAIDIAADGSLYVIDKTGRIQHLTQQGDFINVITMPDIEAGKPTGMTIAPDGNIYVADTHCYRVLIFSPAGEIIGQFGKYGQDDGCFIYPTDVAFSGQGKIFVSEYGGNDRVSVFDEKGEFLYCFGTCGDGENQFARPSALCVDRSRQRLYVADACNHRIAIYAFDGSLLGYIGSAGTAAGELRYPYDLTMLSDGTLVVCEFGNNRLQLFTPEGQSLAVYGGPGRQLGQLAYPWGVTVDSRGRAFVVDAGNNRIQVWQL